MAFLTVCLSSVTDQARGLFPITSTRKQYFLMLNRPAGQLHSVRNSGTLNCNIHFWAHRIGPGPSRYPPMAIRGFLETETRHVFTYTRYRYDE
jgi:hypothetical protein